MSGACPIKKTDEAPAAARVSRSQERRALAAQQTVDNGGDHEVVETESRVTCFQLPGVDQCAWMVCRRGGSIHRTAGVGGLRARLPPPRPRAAPRAPQTLIHQLTPLPLNRT